jgi:hypothetical protein
VLGFTPTLGQSRVATEIVILLSFSIIGGHVEMTRCLKISKRVNFVFIIGFFSTLGSFVEDFSETSSTSCSFLVHTTY